MILKDRNEEGLASLRLKGTHLVSVVSISRVGSSDRRTEWAQSVPVGLLEFGFARLFSL